MKKLLSSRNNLILLIVLLLGLALIIVVIRKPQQTKTQAAIDQTLDHINLSYPTSQMKTSDYRIEMSAQGVNSANQMIDGVSYTWGISSNGSIGRLSTSGNIATFQPLNNGVGDIFVTATKNGITKTKSFRMTVGDTIKNSISWQTADALLTADDFYIMTNDRKFTSANASVRVISDSAKPPYFDRTTLEATWLEHGVEMRLFLYFNLDRNTNIWKIYEIRTYDGSGNNSWIYYPGFTGNSVGQSYTNNSLNLSSYLPQYPDSLLPGSIHFENVRIQAFLTLPQIPSSGYYIYSQDSLTVPVNTGDSYLGFWPTLYYNGEFVTDQTQYSYLWTIDDPSIASIYPDNVCRSDDMVRPCPESFLTVEGIKTGSTNIRLSIKNTSTNTTLASKIFTVTVSPSLSPTPTLAISTNKIQYNFFLHGRGNGGDNANRTSGGNKNLIHRTLPLELTFYNDFGTYITSLPAEISYNDSSGSYTGFTYLPDNFPTGTFIVKAKVPSYLRKQLSGFYSIRPGYTTSLNYDFLTVGDALDDNQLNILDYNMLIGCYEDLLPASNCDAQKKLMTDFNDDGYVNQIDFNLFLREISVQAGD